MELSDVLVNALEYYDKICDTHSDFIKTVKYYVFYEEDNSDLVDLYDVNEKIIMTGNIEYSGYYDNITNIWTWGWATPNLNKRLVNTSRKILNYGIDIDPSTESNKLLKSELITSRYKISSQIQLDVHNALACYLSKQQMMMRFVEYYGDKPDEILKGAYGNIGIYKKHKISGVLHYYNDNITIPTGSVHYMFITKMKFF